MSKCEGSNVIYGPGNCDGYAGEGRESIQYIQNMLVTLDYLTVAEVTGQFGSKTYAAVQKFQQDYGLATDGQVGPQTLNLMKEQSDARRTALALHSASEGAGELPAPKPPDFWPDLMAKPWFWPAAGALSALLIGGALMVRARK